MDEEDKFEQFTSLPLDIQREILDMSNVYDLTRTYSEDMKHYKERRKKCMKIEEEEIVKAFNKDDILLVFYEDRFHSLIAANKNEFFGFEIDEDIHNLYDLQYVRMGRIILYESEDTVNSEYYIQYMISDLQQTHYRKNEYISHILLLPSSISTIVHNREDICDRYIRDIIYYYIYDEFQRYIIKGKKGGPNKKRRHTYNKKQTLAWIMLCLNDIGIDYSDILSYYGYGTSENPEIKVYTTSHPRSYKEIQQNEQVIESFNNIITSLYNRLLESI